jgi:hypothetical protein
MGTNVSEDPAASFFRGEGGDSKFLQNVSTCLLHSCILLYPRIPNLDPHYWDNTMYGLCLSCHVASIYMARSISKVPYT